MVTVTREPLFDSEGRCIRMGRTSKAPSDVVWHEVALIAPNGDAFEIGFRRSRNASTLAAAVRRVQGKVWKLTGSHVGLTRRDSEGRIAFQFGEFVARFTGRTKAEAQAAPLPEIPNGGAQ